MSASIVRLGIATLAFSVTATGCAPDAGPTEAMGATTSHLDDGPSAIEGVCGSASLTLVDMAPSQNLCVAGATSAVTGPATGPWDWSCTGTSGVSARCSAVSKKSVSSSDAARDNRGALLESIYTGIFGHPMDTYVYDYWVTRYDPSGGVNCRTTAQAFILAWPERTAATAATSPESPALTGYIETLYRALLPTFPTDNTSKIAGWRISGELTMDQLDAIFLGDAIFTARCEEAGMQ